SRTRIQAEADVRLESRGNETRFPPTCARRLHGTPPRGGAVGKRVQKPGFRALGRKPGFWKGSRRCGLQGAVRSTCHPTIRSRKPGLTHACWTRGSVSRETPPKPTACCRSGDNALS